MEACRLCPRLTQYRESVLPKKKFQDDCYWKKPVKGFGDLNARLFVLGLAPSSHGGNRTGRIFTGDETGRFLFRILHQEGFANQPTGETANGGLILKDCYLTAAVKCAPPKDKPTPEEFSTCSEYWWQELQLLKNAQAILLFGQLSLQSFQREIKKRGYDAGRLAFGHGKTYDIDGLPKIYASYHPSPRNTNTGTLTEVMLQDVLRKIKSGFK